MGTRRTSGCGGLLAAALLCWGGIAHAAERAPAFTLPGLVTGAAYSSESMRGRVSVVTFWASWCAPRALGMLEGLQQEFGPRGLAAIAINLDEEPLAARGYVGDHSFGIELLRDAAGATPLAFEVKAMPASYVLDCEGRIRARLNGARADAGAALRAQIEGLLAAGCRTGR